MKFNTKINNANCRDIVAMISENNTEEDQKTLSQFDILYEISRLLNTGLSKETLKACATMIEDGMNPLALADFIKKVTEHCKA